MMMSSQPAQTNRNFHFGFPHRPVIYIWLFQFSSLLLSSQLHSLVRGYVKIPRAKIGLLFPKTSRTCGWRISPGVDIASPTFRRIHILFTHDCAPKLLSIMGCAPQCLHGAGAHACRIVMPRSIKLKKSNFSKDQTPFLETVPRNR
jgi:hypothetical protein